MQSRLTLALLAMFMFVLPATTTMASSVFESFASQYQWNTNGSKGSGKWNSHNAGKSHQELNDASGGDPWDIKAFGTGVERYGDKSFFKFGAMGGSILSGTNKHGQQELHLSDIAINVAGNGDANPTKKSSGWDYAIRLMGLSEDGTNKNQRRAKFKILEGGEWEGSDIYNGARGHVTNTFKMKGGKEKGEFSGIYTKNKEGHNILEGHFDLGMLSLFNEKTRGGIGSIITYLTMSCVNDEVLVHADVSPVPVPAAFWLFGTALLGFIGVSRRTTV